MEARYYVLRASKEGDYSNEVCGLLENSGVLARGSDDLARSVGDIARYSANDETVVSVANDNRKTVVRISRDLGEEIAEAEMKITRVRTCLSLILKGARFTLH